MKKTIVHKPILYSFLLLLILSLITIGGVAINTSTATAPAVFTAVSAGYTQTLYLKNDGTVWVSGSADYAQLGEAGVTRDRTTLVQVSGLSGITAVAAGDSHSLALKNDGSVWAWGYNTEGELGDGTTTDRTTPVQVSNLSAVTAIAAARQHSVALKSNGTVWTWGNDDVGQLGNGDFTQSTVPVQVAALNGITAIDAADFSSLALKSDGTVFGWGYNESGELGDGTTTMRETPVQVTGLNGVTAISIGGRYTGTPLIIGLHSMARKSDGSVWAWGSNTYGQIGDGTTTNRLTAVQVSTLSGITAVSAGESHSAALKNDGTMWTWGNNASGQLGDGTTTQRTSPVQVTSLSGVTVISAGGPHTLAIMNDDTIRAWGANTYGQLGFASAQKTVPVTVSGLTNVIATAGGQYHSLALKSDGTVWAWGYNNFGQLGDGTNTDRTTPVQVSSLSGIIAISAGESHSIALKSDGTVWGWGYNGYRQLADGTFTNRSTPVRIPDLYSITGIVAGGYHNLAVRSDNTVWAWGANGFGQIGNGTIDGSIAAPVQITTLSDVASLAAGYSNSFARKNDGTVWAWGYNNFGQLGDSSTTNRSTPVQVATLTGVTSIFSGKLSHAFAIKSDGTVWAWGYNANGQLGDSSTTNRSTPVQVATLAGVTNIGGGYSHTVALKTNNTALSFGLNSYNQLGDRTVTQRTSPVRVSSLTGITSVSSGFYHSLAIKSDGTVRAWGYNTYGQLGDGTKSYTPTPTLVESLGSPFTLTVTKSGSGAGAVAADVTIIDCGVDCSDSYNPDTVVSLEATPNVGSILTSWGGDCSVTGQVTMTANKTCTAEFTLQNYTLTANKSGTGTGTITSNPAGITCGTDCIESYGAGNTITLTPVPTSNSIFAGWSGDSDCSDGQVILGANTSCVASFNLVTTLGSGATLGQTPPSTSNTSSNFTDVSVGEFDSQTIADIHEIVNLMVEKNTYETPTAITFSPYDKTTRFFAIQVALAVAGSSCGETIDYISCKNAAVTKGLIDPENMPDRFITRVQYYDMLLKAANISLLTDATLINKYVSVCRDVVDTNPYTNIIATARSKKIAPVYEGYTCNATLSFPRYSAAVFAGRTLDALGQ